MSSSEPKVGEKCPYCTNCFLKSFRIDVDEWIVKCESMSCLYPIAISKEQCFSCREENVSENAILDDFFDEILSNKAFEQLSSQNSVLDLIPVVATEPESLPQDSVFGLLPQPESSSQNAIISKMPDVLPEPRTNAVEQQENKTEEADSFAKITRHLDNTKTSSPSCSSRSSSSGSPNKIKNGNNFRRIVKHDSRSSVGEESGGKDVTKSVTHMELDSRSSVGEKLEATTVIKKVTHDSITSVEEEPEGIDVTKSVALINSDLSSSIGEGTEVTKSVAQMKRIVKRDSYTSIEEQSKGIDVTKSVVLINSDSSSSNGEEPTGKDVSKSVAHMKPLDYVNYLMQQKP